MVLSGRPSDPCEEVLTISSGKSVDHRSHAYGTCATNGGQPRIRCSIGVGTKDDQEPNSEKTRENATLLTTPRGGATDLIKDNGSMASGSSNSSNVRCLKLRLRSKFRSAGSGSRRGQRPPSKETREVIDMGKMSAVSLTSAASASSIGGTAHNNSSSKRGHSNFPLNGILKKMETKSDQARKNSTTPAAAGTYFNIIAPPALDHQHFFSIIRHSPLEKYRMFTYQVY